MYEKLASRIVSIPGIASTPEAEAAVAAILTEALAPQPGDDEVILNAIEILGDCDEVGDFDTNALALRFSARSAKERELREALTALFDEMDAAALQCPLCNEESKPGPRMEGFRGGDPPEPESMPIVHSPDCPFAAARKALED